MTNPAAGRTVRLFLVDGTPNGLITAEIMNWTGHVLVSPRTRLPEVLARSEASRTGVYFLIGDDPEDPTRNRVYIGESDNVGKRILQHSKDESKDFWEKLCLVTSKDQNLTKAHVRYLESRLIDAAYKANRVIVANGTAPEFGYLPESDLADMEFFLTQIGIVLPVLGFEFLKPPLQHAKSTQSSSKTSQKAEESGPLELVLNSTKHGLYAEAIFDGDEIMVLAGAKAIVEGDFNTNYARPVREKLIANGSLKKTKDGRFYEFTQNVSFPAPSTAAAVIFDRNSNGRTAWKVKATGQTLKDWQNSQLPSNFADKEVE